MVTIPEVRERGETEERTLSESDAMVMADGGSMEGCLISGEANVEGLGAYICGDLGAGAGGIW